MKVQPAEIINLTPHAIQLISHSSYVYKDQAPNIVLTLPPSGRVARVDQVTSLDKQISVNGAIIDITTVVPRELVELPKKQPGVYYAVSKLVAEQLKGRGDLLVMHGLYKQHSKTIGCRSFTLW